MTDGQYIANKAWSWFFKFVAFIFIFYSVITAIENAQQISKEKIDLDK